MEAGNNLLYPDPNTDDAEFKLHHVKVTPIQGQGLKDVNDPSISTSQNTGTSKTNTYSDKPPSSKDAPSSGLGNSSQEEQKQGQNPKFPPDRAKNLGHSIDQTKTLTMTPNLRKIDMGEMERGGNSSYLVDTVLRKFKTSFEVCHENMRRHSEQDLEAIMAYIFEVFILYQRKDKIKHVLNSIDDTQDELKCYAKMFKIAQKLGKIQFVAACQYVSDRFKQANSESESAKGESKYEEAYDDISLSLTTSQKRLEDMSVTTYQTEEVVKDDGGQEIGYPLRLEEQYMNKIFWKYLEQRRDDVCKGMDIEDILQSNGFLFLKGTKDGLKEFKRVIVRDMYDDFKESIQKDKSDKIKRLKKMKNKKLFKQIFDNPSILNCKLMQDLCSKVIILKEGATALIIKKQKEMLGGHLKQLRRMILETFKRTLEIDNDVDEINYVYLDQLNNAMYYLSEENAKVEEFNHYFKGTKVNLLEYREDSLRIKNNDKDCQFTICSNETKTTLTKLTLAKDIPIEEEKKEPIDEQCVPRESGESEDMSCNMTVFSDVTTIRFASKDEMYLHIIQKIIEHSNGIVRPTHALHGMGDMSKKNLLTNTFVGKRDHVESFYRNRSEESANIAMQINLLFQGAISDYVHSKGFWFWKKEQFRFCDEEIFADLKFYCLDSDKEKVTLHMKNYLKDKVCEVDKSALELEDDLMAIFEANFNNKKLAKNDSKSKSIKNVTLWFQIYLGSLLLAQDIDGGCSFIRRIFDKFWDFRKEKKKEAKFEIENEFEKAEVLEKLCDGDVSKFQKKNKNRVYYRIQNFFNSFAYHSLHAYLNCILKRAEETEEEMYILFDTDDRKKAMEFSESNIIGTLMFELPQYKMLTKQEYLTQMKSISNKVVVIGKYLSCAESDGYHPCVFLPTYIID